MKLKLFLVGIIGFVGTVIMLLTGTLVPILLVIKSFVMFILNFLFGIFLIWGGGQIILLLWVRLEKFRKKFQKPKYKKKIIGTRLNP